MNAALASGAVAALVELDGVDAFDLADARVLAVPGLKTQAGAIASLSCLTSLATGAALLSGGLGNFRTWSSWPCDSAT